MSKNLSILKDVLEKSAFECILKINEKRQSTRAIDINLAEEVECEIEPISHGILNLCIGARFLERNLDLNQLQN